MVLLVLVPLLLGVVAYRVPLPVSKVLILISQLGAIAFTLDLLRIALQQGTVWQQLGGDDRRLYIELAGTPVSLSLTILTSLLMLGATLVGWRFATHKLLLLYGILQGLVSGIFLTDDIFNLFVLLEVLTIVMVLLNVYKKEVRVVYDALYYLIIQIIGMTFFLLGLAYLYRATGQLSMTLINQVIDSGSVNGRMLVLPFALMLCGLGLKVGLFPLYSYVPRFYGNPGAPLSVLMLSSSLLSTAILFWIARIAWAFAPLNTAPMLLALGFLTAVAGAVKALAQRDARLVLAFSTVSQSGLALIALGSGTAMSQRGFIAHLFAHAIAKALLFLAVGALLDRGESSDVANVRQVVWRYPVIAVAMVLGAISLIGIPLTAGGISKYWIMSGGPNWLIEASTWVVTLGTALIMAKLLLPLVGGFDGRDFVAAQPTNNVATRPTEVATGWLSSERKRTTVSSLRSSADSLASVETEQARFDAQSASLPGTSVAAVGVLAVGAFLILLGGMAGTRAMGALMGAFPYSIGDTPAQVAAAPYFGIAASSLAIKAIQLLGVLLLALALTWLLPKLKSWQTPAFENLRSGLAGSLSLPNACLALTSFFLGFLLFAFLPGVM